MASRHAAPATLRPLALRAVGVNREVLHVEVSAPGVYEIRLERLGTGRFHTPAPQLVDVRAAGTIEVLIDLERK